MNYLIQSTKFPVALYHVYCISSTCYRIPSGNSKLLKLKANLLEPALTDIGIHLIVPNTANMSIGKN